jgi:hypothetical protein
MLHSVLVQRPFAGGRGEGGRKTGTDEVREGREVREEREDERKVRDWVEERGEDG